MANSIQSLSSGTIASPRHGNDDKPFVPELRDHSEEIVWKDINGFEGLYQVSNIGGKVKSLSRILCDGRSWEGGILKPSIHEFGYSIFVLSKDTLKKSCLGHILVMETFKPTEAKGMYVLHNDGNSRNNDLSNLRWGTQKQNIQDSIKHGTFVSGSKNGKAKLSEADVIEIKKMIRDKKVQSRDIAKIFKVVPTAISNIKNGWTWKQVVI